MPTHVIVAGSIRLAVLTMEVDKGWRRGDTAMRWIDDAGDEVRIVRSPSRDLQSLPRGAKVYLGADWSRKLLEGRPLLDDLRARGHEIEEIAA